MDSTHGKVLRFQLPPQIGNIGRLSGTFDFQKQIEAGMSEAEIRKTWEPGLVAFKETRKKYLLCP